MVRKVTAKSVFPGAEEFLPEAPNPSLKVLREAAASCRGCDLYQDATQTVFGEGPRHAQVLFIGEQPGDEEDTKGHPFVGPAGKLLDRALKEAGIDRTQVFVTNAVKHFKWEGMRGKKRLHSKPSARQVAACRAWLEKEISLVRPEVVVLLGATAAHSIKGGAFRITKERGKLLPGEPWAPYIVATVHPSSILRAPDDDERDRQYAAFVDDLRVVAKAAHEAAKE